MIVVRVARGIREHFPARASEWGFAGLLIYVGILLTYWPDTFNASRSYAGLAALADEEVWGRGCIIVGCLRLIALIVNGTFADTWYGRWSPHVRGVCAFLSCGVWLLLLGGFMDGESGRPLLIPGFIGCVLAIDFYNIRRVWADAGRAHKAAGDADES